MRILFVFCLVLGGFLSPVQAARPSFDCGKASNRVEQVICQSDALAQQDVELSRLYRQVSKGLPSASRNDLKQEQLTWLKERNRDCALPGQDAESCLAGKYRQRNRELAALLAFDSTRDQSTGDELKVLRVTPKGNDVPAGRQIVFQFDRPVVPIGKMARDSKEIPVTITPALACEWRWLNTSALACQLTEAEQMHPATRYEVIMQPGLRTLDGATLKPHRSAQLYHGPAEGELYPLCQLAVAGDPADSGQLQPAGDQIFGRNRSVHDGGQGAAGPPARLSR